METRAVDILACHHAETYPVRTLHLRLAAVLIDMCLDRSPRDDDLTPLGSIRTFDSQIACHVGQSSRGRSGCCVGLVAAKGTDVLLLLRSRIIALGTEDMLTLREYDGFDERTMTHGTDEVLVNVRDMSEGTQVDELGLTHTGRHSSG